MSPGQKQRPITAACFPRTRGDEPVTTGSATLVLEFSPHARG